MIRLSKSVLFVVLSLALTLQVSGQKKHEKERITFLFNLAVDEYNQKLYENSAENFTKMLEISDVYYLDSVAVYYNGLASMKAKKYDQAIEHFNRCIQIGYKTEKSIYNLATILKNTEDDQAYIETLKEGLETSPNSALLLGHIVDYYIEKEQLSNANIYIDSLILLTPENPKLFFTKAAIYAEEDNIEESNQYYKKAIELYPKYFDAYFRLGANYFNKGAEYYEMADTVRNAEIKTEDVENYISSFKNAMTYMEKAYEIKPNEKSLLEALQDVYSLMQTEEEVYKTCYEEITKKLNGEENNFIPSENFTAD